VKKFLLVGGEMQKVPILLTFFYLLGVEGIFASGGNKRACYGVALSPHESTVFCIGDIANFRLGSSGEKASSYVNGLITGVSQGAKQVYVTLSYFVPKVEEIGIFNRAILYGDKRSKRFPRITAGNTSLKQLDILEHRKVKLPARYILANDAERAVYQLYGANIVFSDKARLAVDDKTLRKVLDMSIRESAESPLVNEPLTSPPIVPIVRDKIPPPPPPPPIASSVAKKSPLPVLNDNIKRKVLKSVDVDKAVLEGNIPVRTRLNEEIIAGHKLRRVTDRRHDKARGVRTTPSLRESDGRTDLQKSIFNELSSRLKNRRTVIEPTTSYDNENEDDEW
jgi:hypothetical protein